MGLRNVPGTWDDDAQAGYLYVDNAPNAQPDTTHETEADATVLLEWSGDALVGIEVLIHDKGKETWTTSRQPKSPT